MNTKIKRFTFLLILLLSFSFLISFSALAVDATFEPKIEIEGVKEGPVDSQSIGYYIKAIYKYGVALGTILAIIIIMVGGIIWLTSGGSPDKVNNAKSFIGGAFIGVILLLGSYLLLQTINPDLINLSLPEITQITSKEFGSAECEWKKINSSLIEGDYYYSKAPDSQCLGERPLDSECRCPTKFSEAEEKAGCCTKNDGWVEFKSSTGKEECIEGCPKDRCVSMTRDNLFPFICCVPSGGECGNAIDKDWQCCSNDCQWRWGPNECK